MGYVLDLFEAEELVRGIFGLSDDEDVEQKLLDEFDISIEQWISIASTLIMFTPVVESPITKTKYHAFIRCGIAMAKIGVE